MIAFFLFFSLSAFAASNSMNAFETAYPRDNTFCSLNNHRVEFLIRGGSKFIEPKDKGYGEYIFVKNKNKKPMLLQLNKLRGDTYRFFLGSSPLCSKSHGYKIDDSTLAILFLKENRPFRDKLVIQHFDFKSLTPKEVIETNYPVDKALKTSDGFAFKTSPENHRPEFGKVNIEGQSFIFQEKDFPLWVNYSSKGFEPSSVLSFQRFPWQKAFKDQEDFHQVTGWSEAEKMFTKTILYLAVNHTLKKECLLFITAKQKLAGNEAWRCYAI
jgi:hypothetical protein